MRVWLARRMADGAVHCIHLRRQGAVLSRLAFALATGCGADRGSRTKSARGAVAFLPQSAHYRRELFARCEQRLDGPSDNTTGGAARGGLSNLGIAILTSVDCTSSSTSPRDKVSPA